MIEYIYAMAHIDGGEGALAIIIRAIEQDKQTGIRCTKFLTTRSDPLQLGLLRFEKGEQVQPHIHLPISRHTEKTQEILFIRSGSVHISIYDTKGMCIQNVILKSNDVIMFVSGGHKLIALEDTEIVEVKSGPYFGKEIDKIDFPG